MPSVTRVVKFIRKGDDGRGISSITEYYLATSAASGVTTSTSGWTTAVQTVTASKKYLWNYEKIKYSDGTVQNTAPVIIGTYGDTGDPGNGISETNTYYIATTLSTGVTSPRTSVLNPSAGWVKGVFQPATEAKPYAWKYTETVYTNGGKVYTDAELISTYKAGTNPNLLDNTTFENDESMGAWDIINKINSSVAAENIPDGILTGANGYQGRNAFRGGTRYSRANISYKEILRQPILSKLKPSTWYTLSYWVRALSDSLFYGDGVTSSDYGFSQHKLYLQANHNYYFQIVGHISQQAKNAGHSLRAFIYNSSWTWHRVLEIKETKVGTMVFTIIDDVPSTGEYFLQFYSYKDNFKQGDTLYPVTIERAYIREANQIEMTHIFPGAIDTNVKGYVDGIETTLSSDGAVNIGSCDWTLHTFTFKTKSQLPAEEQYVLFRLMPNVVTSKGDGSMYDYGLTYAEICMPKLEIGMQPTGYIPSDKDLKGGRGPALRGPQDWEDCADGYNFQAGGENDEWKDVVIYDGSYYCCTKNHVKTANNYPLSTEDNNKKLWRKGDKMEFVATKILLATYALVKNLGVEAVQMKDDNGNILFEVKDGNVTCKTGTFENIKVYGSLRNPFSLVNDSFDVDYNDNVALLSDGGGWVNAYSLPWDVSQSGRKISMVNYRWGSRYAEGMAEIDAPSGKFFYEDGLQKSKLRMSREIIELIGYGTSTEFYGWIVVSRIDLMPTQRYGHCLKVLAYGTCTGGDTAAKTSLVYSTFDGSQLSVTRQSTGIYRITYPNTWFNNSAHCRVIPTGRGNVLNANSPSKANLHSIGANYFEVSVSDDESRNDGSFDFIVYNGSDFNILHN